MGNIKVIRKGDTSSFRSSSRQRKHLVSATDVSILPKISLTSSTSAMRSRAAAMNTISLMSIQPMSEPDAPETPPVEAVKQMINVNFDANGTCNLTDTINLGSQFDRYVTILHFDLNNLNWRKSNGTEYLFKLAFYDSLYSENVSNVYGTSSEFDIALEKEPLVFQFDGSDFYVPREITKYATTYQIVLIIEEKIQDLPEGNFSNLKEVFVSDIFKGKVTANFYNTESWNLADALPIMDKEIALSKNNISIVLADDGTMAVSNNILGNLYDQYIRTFDFRHVTFHLNQFKTFLLFKQDNLQYISAFDVNGYGVIPSAVTKSSGTWEVMIVGYVGEDINDPDYFYCSTVIKMKVNDNFLIDEIFTSDYSKNSNLAGNYSNFITADNKMIQTADGEIFYWNEQ